MIFRRSITSDPNTSRHKKLRLSFLHGGPRNSVEAGISILDYQAQSLSLAISLDIFWVNYYLFGVSKISAVEAQIFAADFPTLPTASIHTRSFGLAACPFGPATPPPRHTDTPPHTWASPKLANWAINLLAPTQLYKIMFNLEKAHFILDEMVQNGTIFETNKQNVLTVRRQNSTERGQNKKI